MSEAQEYYLFYSWVVVRLDKICINVSVFVYPVFNVKLALITFWWFLFDNNHTAFLLSSIIWVDLFISMCSSIYSLSQFLTSEINLLLKVVYNSFSLVWFGFNRFSQCCSEILESISQIFFLKSPLLISSPHQVYIFPNIQEIPYIELWSSLI